MNYLPRLASNCDLPDFCFLSSKDCRCEPLAPGICLKFLFFQEPKELRIPFFSSWGISSRHQTTSDNLSGEANGGTLFSYHVKLNFSEKVKHVEVRPKFPVKSQRKKLLLCLTKLQPFTELFSWKF
jgi:hypothetical protein